jgi:hypothetical protein
VDPSELRAAVERVAPWLDGTGEEPARGELAAAVRLAARALAQEAPGRSVELRVPPFVAVQCLAGPPHTRGTPPAVVETDAGTWLCLATGRLDWSEAVSSGRVLASGERADLAALLPVARI